MKRSQSLLLISKLVIFMILQGSNISFARATPIVFLFCPELGRLYFELSTLRDCTFSYHRSGCVPTRMKCAQR